MDPLTFGDIALLRPAWLAVAVALAALAVAARARRPTGRDGWHRVMSPAVLAWLGGDTARGARRERLPLVVAALVAVVLAAPATRRHDAESFRHSSGWIALVDVSRSMTLDDTLPTRLGAARETLLALSARAGARPIALILYAGDAFLVAPSTFERRLLEEQAALLEHGVVPLEGSNLARALSLASSVAVDGELLRARVFVLGDSGGSGKAAEAAARHLAEADHRVDVVLFGAEKSEAAGAVSDTDREAERTGADDTDGTLGTGAATGKANTVSTEAADAAGSDGADAPPANDANRRNPRAALESADATSSTAASTAGALAADVAATERLARAGGGELVRADALGRVELDALGLDRERGPADVAALRTVLWEDRSHWLLIALLPLALALFRPRPDDG